MARYPVLSGGDPFAVETLNAIIPDFYYKSTSTDRNTTVTLTDDPEIAGIPLGIGTWFIHMGLLISSTNTTDRIQTGWGFTGTWTAPTRICMGPGIGNSAGNNAVTPVRLAAVVATTAATYGTGNAGSVQYAAQEEGIAVVTAAGNLSLQWSQATSDANNSTMRLGTLCWVKQIA